jgi:hypothetical protein
MRYFVLLIAFVLVASAGYRIVEGLALAGTPEIKAETPNTWGRHAR